MTHGILERGDRLGVHNHGQKNAIGKWRVLRAIVPLDPPIMFTGIYSPLFNGGKMSKHRSALQKLRARPASEDTVGNADAVAALLRNMCPSEVIPSQEELSL